MVMLYESFLCGRTVFGYLYPAYECFKTIENKQKKMEHIIFWCQYWILVAVLTSLERVGDAFISWVPIYNEAKLAFYIYLWYPKVEGTTYVYNTFLRPYIATHEEDIDQLLSQLKITLRETLNFYWHQASIHGQKLISEISQFLNSQSAASMDKEE
ncbi:TB2/DP1/HVA22-related protein [Dillenia turbinata]|uniref:HVA22-like protein n=1 Tax=Dillenia turbinata TaxID=194707 RepID=A0AAN8UIN4_9MAGN